MITYNPNYLDNTDIFTTSEIQLLEELNKKVPLKKYLNNKSYIEKFGLDFIHTSALIEGNTKVIKMIIKIEESRDNENNFRK
jgi:hypothetical protein